MFVQHRDIDRMLGHQVGDELVAVDGVELVGFLKIHAKEFARDPVPEGRPARLVDHPAQFGQNAVAKARAVPRDEQIRSEERRGGEEGVSTGGSRWSRKQYKKKE